MILHKGDETISCEREQLDIMKKAGWSREKPPEAGTDAEDTKDDPSIGTGADASDIDDKAPVDETENDSAPKTKKKLKKKI